MAMMVASRTKGRSRKVSAKNRKTFPRALPPELKALIALGNSLSLSETSLRPVNDEALLLQEELKSQKQAGVDTYLFWKEVLRRCLEGISNEIRDFVVTSSFDTDATSQLLESLARYEDLRLSLNRLSSLAHANKLIQQRNERNEDLAILTRAYFDGQNDISKARNLNSRELEDYTKKLYRIREEVEMYESNARNRRLTLNHLQKLAQSFDPTFVSTKIDAKGTIYYVKDLLSEAIEGVEGAAFRIRECAECSYIFWANNIKTVVCSEHIQMRRNERTKFGTKKDRLSGRIDSGRMD